MDPFLFQWDATNLPSANIVTPGVNPVLIDFGSTGQGLLCVTVQSFCFEADSCKLITIIDGPQAGADDFSCDNTYAFAAQSIGALGVECHVTTPSGTAMATFDDVNDPNTTVTVNEFGTYQFNWGLAGDCSDDVFITFVDSLRMLGAETYDCDNTNTTYTIQFTVEGGLPAYGVTTGNGTMTGDIFMSDPIPSNDGFTVTIQDAAGCDRTFVFNPHECTCATEGGTMEQTLLESCGVACHQAVSNLDTMMDGNDVAEYILHDQPGASISTVIARNGTGEFCFIPGTTLFDVTYYISLVVGDDLGGGQVDLTEGCTRVAPGQPVIWREIPAAAATTGISTCLDSIGLLATPSVGVGTWSTVSGPGAATFTNINAPQPIVRVDQCGRYTFQWKEDNNGCADSVEIQVDFYCNPEVLSIQTPCNGTQTAINLTIELQNGTEPYSEDNSRGMISGSTFTIDDLPLMTPDTFYFTDDNGCQLTVPVIIGDCSCITESGGMNASLVNECQDGTVTVVHDAAIVFDANDSLRFMAHTRTDDTLGTVIAVSITPTFVIADGPFECDTIYYVSAVAGNWNGSGIDLSDPCLNVSVGQPIRFDCEVMVDAGTDTDTCDLAIDLQATSSTGAGTWSALTAGATISTVDPLTGAATLPGPGQYTFEFTASNGNCTGSDQVTITVPDAPSIVPGSFSVSCNSDNDMYTVSLQITGGDPASYTVIGLGSIDLSGNFTSNPIPSGDPFDFQFFDQFDCIRADTAGTYTCPCVSQVGDMTPEVVHLCEDESVDASAFYIPGTIEMMDTRDVRNYILSDNQADPTSNILDANTTGMFSFNGGYTYGTTYFIAVIIGDPTGPSTVDINDPCLSVSGTMEVTWYNRIDMFEIDTSASRITCQDPQVTLSILTSEDLTGYDILWTPSNGGNIEPGDEVLPVATGEFCRYIYADD